MFGILRPVWKYRGFVLGSVKREFQTKYRNSLLGAAWNIINPLAMIVVYTVIFSQVMQTRLPGVANTFGYSIYLCAGVLTWGLFTEITTRSQNMFLDNANLLKNKFSSVVPAGGSCCQWFVELCHCFWPIFSLFNSIG